MPDAEEVTAETSDTIQLIDAGTNWSGGRCPGCGARFADDWWSTEVTKSFETSGFADRRVVLPCCGSESDLNDLDYGQWPVAFATWWVDCMNPNIGRLDDRQVEAIAAALGQSVSIVYQHL